MRIGVVLSGGPCAGQRLMVRPVKPWLGAGGALYEAPWQIMFDHEAPWVDPDEGDPDAPVPLGTIRYRFTAQLSAEALWVYEHEETT